MAKDLDPKTRAVALRLFNENLDVVDIALRNVCRGRRLPLMAGEDDLRAIGMFGLWKAALSGGDHPEFRKYAYVRAEGAMLDALRDATKFRSDRERKHRVKFVPITETRNDSEGEDFTSEERLVDHYTANPETEAIRAQEQVTARKLVRLLPPRLQPLVQRVFWDGERHADAARRMGISEPRISQLLSRALAKLRDRVRK